MTFTRTVQEVPLYGGRYVVLVTDDPYNTLKQLDYKDMDSEQEWKGITAQTVYDSITRKSGFVVSRWTMALRPNAQLSTVAHEAAHITFAILGDRGASYEYTNMAMTEPYAYLLDWVVHRAVLAVMKHDKTLAQARLENLAVSA